MCGPDGQPPTKAHNTPPFLHADKNYVLEELAVTFEGYTYKSWIAYKRNALPAPVILCFPNYAGLKQFDKDQAMFMAKLGYVGVAVDLYKEVPGYMYADRNPVVDFDGALPKHGYANFVDVNMPEGFQKAGSGHPELMTPAQLQGLQHFQKAFGMYHACLKAKAYWRNLMDATLASARKHTAAHPKLASALGYCFGGQCVLELVRAGTDVQGVISFHGLLQSEPTNLLHDPNFDATVDMVGVKDVYNKKCKVLIENGELDDHVPQASIDAFTQEMNANGIDWRIHHYSQTPHGWALPPGVWATAYNELSDRRSTNSMISFFSELFPEFPVQPVECNAAGTRLGQVISPSVSPNVPQAQPSSTRVLRLKLLVVAAAAITAVLRSK